MLAGLGEAACYFASEARAVTSVVEKIIFAL
jgi:hypothetical protein